MCRIRHLIHALGFVALITTIVGCGTDQAVAPEEIQALVVTPSRTHAGTTVEVRGLSVEDLSGLTVSIGGEPGTVVAAPSGALLVGIPLFVRETSLTPAPPTQPLTLELRQDGRLIGEAKDAITVTVPPLAPGSTQQTIDGLTAITDNLEAVALSLATVAGPEQAWLVAAFAAIDTLLTGSAVSSLASRVNSLAASDPEQMALMDRLIGAGPLLDQIRLANQQVLALAAPASALQRVPTELTDSSLAARMQLHVMVGDFGQQVIGATATTWGNITAILSAITVVTGLTLPGAVLAGTVGTVLSTVGFVINKVLLSYLPADVDEFELKVIDTLVEPGEVPATEIWITASNSPASITVLDLVGLVLRGLGIAAGSPQAQSIEQVIDQAVNSFLNQLRAGLSAYASSHPDTDLNFDFASIPTMSWKARVTNTRFVDPLTFTPAIIAPAGNNIMAWRAVLDAQGEGRIHALIKSGPEVSSLPTIPGYTYNSGAFGKDIRDTGTEVVNVAPPLIAVATMSSTITPGGGNGLEVRIHSLNALGDPIYRQGVDITISVNGGSASPNRGSTGTDGRFNAIVELDSGSSSVDVSVVAIDDAGRQATASASATADPMVVEVLEWNNVLPPDRQNGLRLQVMRGGVAVAGASVNLIVGGGVSSPSTGTTDANGEFWSTVTADQGVTAVTVVVQVENSGQSVSLNLQAGQGALVIGDAGGDCFASVKLSSGLCGSVFEYDNPSIDGFGLYVASVSASKRGSDGSTASGSVASRMEVGTTAEELYFMDASTTVSLMASSPDTGCMLQARGSGKFSAHFTVSGGSVNYGFVGDFGNPLGDASVSLGQNEPPYAMVLMTTVAGPFELTGALPPGSYVVSAYGLGSLNGSLSANVRFSLRN